MHQDGTFISMYLVEWKISQTTESVWNYFEKKGVRGPSQYKDAVLSR